MLTSRKRRSYGNEQLKTHNPSIKMSKFTDEQMMAAIAKGGLVKSFYDKFQKICQELQEETGCPDEDVDRLLQFLIGRWQ